jgi:hypothetical protein
MLWSDFIGAVASAMLAVPAIKDQIYRFLRKSEEQKAPGSHWPGIRNTIAGAWESKRSEYDGKDSFFLGAGALGLLLSFLLKLGGH